MKAHFSIFDFLFGLAESHTRTTVQPNRAGRIKNTNSAHNCGCEFVSSLLLKIPKTKNGPNRNRFSSRCVHFIARFLCFFTHLFGEQFFFFFKGNAAQSTVNQPSIHLHTFALFINTLSTQHYETTSRNQYSPTERATKYENRMEFIGRNSHNV